MSQSSVPGSLVQKVFPTRFYSSPLGRIDTMGVSEPDPENSHRLNTTASNLRAMAIATRARVLQGVFEFVEAECRKVALEGKLSHVFSLHDPQYCACVAVLSQGVRSEIYGWDERKWWIIFEEELGPRLKELGFKIDINGGRFGCSWTCTVSW